MFCAAVGDDGAAGPVDVAQLRARDRLASHRRERAAAVGRTAHAGRADQQDVLRRGGEHGVRPRGRAGVQGLPGVAAGRRAKQPAVDVERVALGDRREGDVADVLATSRRCRASRSCRRRRSCPARRRCPARRPSRRPSPARIAGEGADQPTADRREVLPAVVGDDRRAGCARCGEPRRGCRMRLRRSGRSRASRTENASPALSVRSSVVPLLVVTTHSVRLAQRTEVSSSAGPDVLWGPRRARRRWSSGTGRRRRPRSPWWRRRRTCP